MWSEPVPASVIVLTWNGLEYTRKCVESILEKTEHPDFELVVVDNGSTDGTLEYLRGLKCIRLIENGENLGFVRGNNVGIKSTDRDVVLMNNDTEIIQPDWLTKMQEVAYSSDEVGIVGCRLIDADGRLVHAGTYMPVPSFWGQEYPGRELDVGQYSRDREVEGVIAACVYIKREVINKIGPLDEDYFSYYEDTDYCLKARKEGFRVLCCGAVTVRHYENVSTDLNRMDFAENFKRSRLTFISKWGDFLKSRYSLKLTWRSRFFGDDFFTRMNRELLHALDSVGVELSIEPLSEGEKIQVDDFLVQDIASRRVEPESPRVTFGYPDDVCRSRGEYEIAYVFTPYDRFTDEQVKRLNEMDEVWVPSRFQLEAASRSGVKRPLEVVPFPVNVDYFHLRIRGYPLEDRYSFLYVTILDESSSWRTVIGAFAECFSSDEKVVLIANLSGSSLTPRFRYEAGPSKEYGVSLVEREVERLGIPLGRAPVVFLVDQRIPHYLESSLIRSVDCVLLADRSSEPGSIGQCAIACGVPVLTNTWGSAAETIDEKSTIGFSSSLVNAPLEGMKWAKIDGDDLKEKLRAVYLGKDAAKAAALDLSSRIGVERSLENVARFIAGRLKAVSGAGKVPP